MARVHVVAEVPEEGRRAFWSSDTATRAIVMQLFRDVGAKAVVAASVPAGSAPVNWQQIGDTGYYAHVFPEKREQVVFNEKNRQQSESISVEINQH
jgi:hypothetical protein